MQYYVWFSFVVIIFANGGKFKAYKYKIILYYHMLEMPVTTVIVRNGSHTEYTGVSSSYPVDCDIFLS